MDITKIDYPEMTDLAHYAANKKVPIEEKLLHHEIVYQVKRDGTNLGVYLDDDNNLQLMTRNEKIARKDVYKSFNEIPDLNDLLFEMLHTSKTNGCEIVVFGELMQKGKSPGRFERHEKTTFEVFDIWSVNHNALAKVETVEEVCKKYGVTCVERYGQHMPHTTEELYAYRDQMLEKVKENKKEGVVGKSIFYGNDGNRYVNYFKEKLEKPEKIKSESDINALPQLLDSEIRGAVEKARITLGDDDFIDASKAMPIVAQYVKKECDKHECENRNPLYKYYKERLEDLK